MPFLAQRICTGQPSNELTSKLLGRQEVQGRSDSSTKNVPRPHGSRTCVPCTRCWGIEQGSWSIQRALHHHVHEIKVYQENVGRVLIECEAPSLYPPGTIRYHGS